MPGKPIVGPRLLDTANLHKRLSLYCANLVSVALISRRVCMTLAGNGISTLKTSRLWGLLSGDGELPNARCSPRPRPDSRRR
jgi:hypothetical protein